MASLRGFNHSAIVRALAIYLLYVLVLIPLSFYVLFPATKSLIARGHVNTWQKFFIHFAPQEASYLVLILILYLFVVRPLHLRPLVGSVSGRRHYLVVFVCIVLSLATLTPLHVLTRPYLLWGIAMFITGLSEEYLFRGVMTRALKDKIGIVWAAIMVSILFGLSHWIAVVFNNGTHFLSLSWTLDLAQDALFGLLCTVVVWRSRSILWAGFLHGMYDWQPWTITFGRHWLTMFHSLSAPLDDMVLLVIAFVGAEVIRRSTGRVDQHSGRFASEAS